jgi:hypothetical protein
MRQRSMRQRKILGLVTVVGISAAALAGCSSSATPTSTTSGSQALVGTFHLTAGSDTGAGASGTYFQMISPGGTIAKGPFFSNPDSAAVDKAYTLLSPGTDGGLITGSYQPNPNPPFDASGNALAASIVQPTKFTAIEFGLSTNATDPQTGKSTPVPTISVKEGKLSGQLAAWAASWNKLNFNQGSPKPDGTSPGLTAPLSGTYNSSTHAFVITWASQVVGGPFNGFTGSWHLQGTFSPGK